MIQKIFFLLFITFLSNSASGITLGSSLGFNLGGLKLNTKENNFYNNSLKDSNFDIGLFYKYNWNIKGTFIGIEFFYDFLNVKNYFENNSIDIRYRYGTNLNLGIDLTENFSLYGIIGYGLIKYRAISDGIIFYDKDNNLKFRALYGFGMAYDLSVSWKCNLEYSIQSLKIDLYDGISRYDFKNTLESVKFSIIYKF